MPGFFKSLGNFFGGTPEKRENVSTLRPEQEGLYKQLINAGKGQGGPGVFGQSYNYYNNLLSDDSADYDSFSAPALRQFNQDIVPGISEQFAGMGSGGLSSSGFRNAQLQASTDLAERLGALRASLRQSGAQGLQNLGQLGLQNYSQNMTTQQGSPGFLSQVAPIIGTAAGAYFGGPAGAAIGNSLGNSIGNSSTNWFNSSPYGQNGPKASPSSMGTGFQAPNFLQSQGGY